MNPQHLYAVIMAGGIGSRFWPMSRARFPKQFHDILGRGHSLIQETWNRLHTFIPADNIYVVTHERYAEIVQAQLPAITPDQILMEPVGRNTAPCIAYAAYKIMTRDPEAVLIVSPADHLIENEAEFQRLALIGAEACLSDTRIMTLGITPTRPDTGYGYIQYIDTPGLRSDFYKVKTFTEKPNLEVARTFIESGDFVWNSGLFIFSAATITDAFSKLLPDMAGLFSEISAQYYTPEEPAAIGQVYAACRSISIDYGIMEQADNVYVIPANFGWSDLGTWGSVHENAHKDPDNNAIFGRSLLYQASQNVVRVSDPNKAIILKNIRDYIIVDTEDALLICPKQDEQFIREIVSELRSQYGEKYI
ncbi:MAG: mannose-1-phosphate guanylyltransferase [Bacteroidia bacterium]|nr:mannose-1-phosphate guanylyltransferase [Bacteroidia bacterium]